MAKKLTYLAIGALAILTASPFLMNTGAAADDACGAKVTSIGGAVYIATDRGLTDDEWIYVESNNQPGLQRGGSGPAASALDPIGGDTDSCQASATPDTLIF
ncbi:MAG: hypothetical protein ACYDCK_15080 [Thermoplasmatota archaeon]